MILTPIRRYGAMILMLLTLVFSSEVLAKTHTTTASQKSGNDSNLLIVFYVQIMPDDFVMQLHRF